MIETHSSCSKVSDTKLCPHCYSSQIIKNGHTKTKKQQYFCKACLKRFLDFYTYKAYLPFTNRMIVQLTKEGVGIRSTARLLCISVTTLLKRLVLIAKDIVKPPIPLGHTYEVDELCFFIKSKKTLYWLVYAIDKHTKIVADFRIGKRTNKTLSSIIQTLINSDARRIYTDKLRSYQSIIPQQIHHTTRYQTNHIERHHLTIRTHLKHFNRRSISHSKNFYITLSILSIYFWS